MNNKKTIDIHTDGACAGNQTESNLGGWGAILEYGKNEKTLYGNEVDTTNNKMELTAVINALAAIKKPGIPVRVFSDSSYIVRCMNEKWYENWLKNNWKNANKKPVENRGLWEQILKFNNKYDIRFYKVKGHVNLNSKLTNVDKIYGKFVEQNGRGFTKDDFIHATEMNNRADELANKGIDELR